MRYRKDKYGNDISVLGYGCIGCGKCEQHCPQHIQIRQELKAVKKTLENPVYRIARWLVKRMKAY